MKRYTYDEITVACAANAYPSCEIRAASGRLNRMLGLTREDLSHLQALAREHRLGFVLLGSRVSGPRSRQHTLHPALAASLPLKTMSRSASAFDPGAEDVEIDKTVIKEFGRSDPRTSDLSIVLIDPLRTDDELITLGKKLELALNARGWSFPVRVFPLLMKKRLRSEEDLLSLGEGYLRGLSPSSAFTSAEWRAGFSEIYTTVNISRAVLSAADWRNGLVTAVLFSASFSLGLGFHWVLPPTGLVFGLFGRYLSRLRAHVARVLGDGITGNIAALLVDASIGALAMGTVIVPVAGLPIGWGTILAGSGSHTLAKGSLRLLLDKRYAGGTYAGQARGVLLITTLNFVQGVVTSLVYAGSRAAWLVQLSICVIGAILLFGPPARRALRQ